MDVESISLSVFSAPQGYYKWLVISLGHTNVPQTFQRRIDDIFKDLNHSCVDAKK